MHYDLAKDLIDLMKVYSEETAVSNPGVDAFISWVNGNAKHSGASRYPEPEWEGKASGRSAESVINTSLVHLYRYAKLHAKMAISGTSFSTPDDFIYLIGLASFGSMTKTELIKLNIHEKSAGMQIVNRLIQNGLAEQSTTVADKRNRIISITPKGTLLLNESLPEIRKASHNVTQPLSENEKMDLIRLLLKLENFHKSRSLTFSSNNNIYADN